ncbi:MAG TPA: hypothetical protein VJ001_14475 [Rhodocyclaceae bacterium]|nr:hypothetical protein [Rhodocyclaceae bacterium]
MNRSESIVKPFEWHAGRAVLPPHIEDLFLMTTPSAEELFSSRQHAAERVTS